MYSFEDIKEIVENQDLYSIKDDFLKKMLRKEAFLF